MQLGRQDWVEGAAWCHQVWFGAVQDRRHPHQWVVYITWGLNSCCAKYKIFPLNYISDMPANWCLLISWLMLCTQNFQKEVISVPGSDTFLKSLFIIEAIIDLWWLWSTFIQVMAWCLVAPSHSLNQCWLFVKKKYHKRHNLTFNNSSYAYFRSCTDNAPEHWPCKGNPGCPDDIS